MIVYILWSLITTVPFGCSTFHFTWCILVLVWCSCCRCSCGWFRCPTTRCWRCIQIWSRFFHWCHLFRWSWCTRITVFARCIRIRLLWLWCCNWINPKMLWQIEFTFEENNNVLKCVPFLFLALYCLSSSFCLCTFASLNLRTRFSVTHSSQLKSEQTLNVSPM